LLLAFKRSVPTAYLLVAPGELLVARGDDTPEVGDLLAEILEQLVA
jgi:hypothetical protein